MTQHGIAGIRGSAWQRRTSFGLADAGPEGAPGPIEPIDGSPQRALFGATAVASEGEHAQRADGDAVRLGGVRRGRDIIHGDRAGPTNPRPRHAQIAPTIGETLVVLWIRRSKVRILPRQPSHTTHDFVPKDP